MLETILFWFLAVMTLTGAFGLVLHRNPVYCALFLILTLFGIAGLFLVLQAEFLAIIQILVYAGAIMVLFLFVIMLLNLGNDEALHENFNLIKGFSVLLGTTLALLLVKSILSAKGLTQRPEFSYGKVENVGKLLLNEYVFPFEAISFVLIAALIGAIVIAKKTNPEYSGRK